MLRRAEGGGAARERNGEGVRGGSVGVDFAVEGTGGVAGCGGGFVAWDVVSLGTGLGITGGGRGIELGPYKARWASLPLEGYRRDCWG